MFYWITIIGKNGEPVEYEDSFLPGIKIPDRIILLLRADFADNVLELCELCHMDRHCHPIGSRGEKYCTILFYDAIKPIWTLEQVC
jgi:hypothetical protein